MESAAVPEFEAATRQLIFSKGMGLPGRVWERGEPIWIPDVLKPDIAHERHFPRAPLAVREGLRAAFGFPILLGGEVLGVLEFFSRELRDPDQELVQMLSAMGSQISSCKRSGATVNANEDIG